MPVFFATCPKGLSEALQKEIESFDSKFKRVSAKQKGVEFETSWEGAFEVNYRSKIASRVLKPVLNFLASTEDQIVPLLNKHDFSKYIPKNGSFALRVKTSDSANYKDQPGMMNHIRVGLVAQFESKGRKDIYINTESPDLEIFVMIYRANFSISLNLSGEPLSNRGYRGAGELAPLRENLAAGLIKLTGWNEKEDPLVDFMCGSGTFLIEAALINHPLNLKNRNFSFESWTFIDKSVVKSARKKALQIRNDIESQVENKNIFGFDQDPRSMASVKMTLESENRLEKRVHLKQLSLKDLQATDVPSEKKGVVILNPPYGKRLGDTEQAKKTYSLIGDVLKKHFKGWKAFIISPDPSLSKELHMKAFFKKQVDNGGVDCVFLGYEIN